MIDVAEILVQWHAGRSLNEMSQSLGVDRKTLRKSRCLRRIVAGATEKISGYRWRLTSRDNAQARAGRHGFRGGGR